MITAKAKAQNARESHAERTAQRKLTFQQKFEQDQHQHALDLQVKKAQAAIELSKSRLRSVEE
jgi:hypothetical protein